MVGIDCLVGAWSEVIKLMRFDGRAMMDVVHNANI